MRCKIYSWVLVLARKQLNDFSDGRYILILRDEKPLTIYRREGF